MERNRSLAHNPVGGRTERQAGALDLIESLLLRSDETVRPTIASKADDLKVLLLPKPTGK